MFSVVSVCLHGVPPYRTPDPPIVQSSSAPRHVHTCSGWTSWYRDPPPPPDMFKLLHNERRKVSKRAVGILLECFLFTIIIEKQECIHAFMLGYTPPLGVDLETPPGVGLETAPPKARPLNFLGVSLETPPPTSGQTSQAAPLVWAWKPERHAGIPPPPPPWDLQGMLGYRLQGMQGYHPSLWTESQTCVKTTCPNFVCGR